MINQFYVEKELRLLSRRYGVQPKILSCIKCLMDLGSPADDPGDPDHFFATELYPDRQI